MARLVFGMNQSLDGYVDHTAFAPQPSLFRHFIREAQAQTGSLYGRRMYEIMRYWDDEQPEWGEDEHAFAAAWRKHPEPVFQPYVGAEGAVYTTGHNSFTTSPDGNSTERSLNTLGEVLPFAFR